MLNKGLKVGKWKSYAYMWDQVILRDALIYDQDEDLKNSKTFDPETKNVIEERNYEGGGIQKQFYSDGKLYMSFEFDHSV